MTRTITACFVVISGLFGGVGWCAQQDSNLRPTAPEAQEVSGNTLQTQPVIVSGNRSPQLSVPIGPLPYLIMVAGNVADLWTTKAAFERGAVEGNGIASGRPLLEIGLSKASFTVGIALAMRLLETHGHPRAARVLGYMDGSLTFGIAAHNAGVQR